MNEQLRGTAEMTAAMTILGTIGWFVVMSDRPAMDVVFWRCVFGAAALVVICGAMGLLRGLVNLRMLIWASLGGVAIVTNWYLLFQSYSMASISVSTAVYNTQPFMLVMFGAVFFGEKLTANAASAALACANRSSSLPMAVLTTRQGTFSFPKA